LRVGVDEFVESIENAVGAEASAQLIPRFLDRVELGTAARKINYLSISTG